MSKKSIIKEMFWGNRGNYDNIPLSVEYQEERQKAYAAYNALEKELSETQRVKLNEYFHEAEGDTVEYAADHFVEGFKLGLIIGMETAESK